MSDASTDLFGSDDTVRDILRTARLWFVVGLGDNPERPAYGVARFLQERGCRIVPVHPMGRVVHGEKGYRTLAEAAASEGTPDVVDVFVNSDRAGEVADQAIEIGAGAVWFQLDVVDVDAAQRVVASGARMVMDRCPAREWPALGPR